MANVPDAVDCDLNTRCVAGEQGNVQDVKPPLLDDVSVDAVSINASDQMFSAVREGNLVVLDSLVRKGANVNEVDKEENPLIFYSAHMITGDNHGSLIEVLKLLIDEGASVNSKNSKKHNLLVHFLTFSRAEMGKMDQPSLQSLFEALEFLITGCESDVFPSSSECSVIHLILLLLQGILQHSFNSGDITMKSIAAEKCYKLLSSILSCSANLIMISAKDHESGNTPLHLWSSLHWHSDHVSMGEMSNTGCSIMEMHANIGKLLISSKAKVNVANDGGETPLHMAQTWSAAKLLCEEGAFANATDLHGNTPLLSFVNSAVMHHERTTPHLPLFELCNKMKTESLEMQWREILDCKMNPWKANGEGETIFSTLFRVNSHSLIEAFLEATRKPGQIQKDTNGDTLLHTLCRSDLPFQDWKISLMASILKSNASIIDCPDGQNQTALQILCQREEHDSVIGEAIEMLHRHDERDGIQDKEGMTGNQRASDKPELSGLPSQGKINLEIESQIPWTPMSEVHRDLLAKVVQGQNVRKIGSYRYNSQFIGEGGFAFVFAGLQTKDGREVAVKRIQNERVKELAKWRELQINLTIDYVRVVRYLEVDRDDDFVYLMLELMEGTLEELLEAKPDLVKENKVSLCHDVVDGLNFLHGKKILHRDIKSGNILYKCTTERPILKLADFGLSKSLDTCPNDTPTVMNSKTGTQCCMAPEVLEGKVKHSEDSDMFACGIALHILLSENRHPFWPCDRSGSMSKHDTVTNIRNGEMTIAEDLNHEAKHLVTQLLDFDMRNRPAAREALNYPFFWSNQTKVSFLWTVGNQPEIVHPWHFAGRPMGYFEEHLESSFKKCREPQTAWHLEIQGLVKYMRQSKRYQTGYAVDLLHLMRNAYSHLPDISPEARMSVEDEHVFFQQFPFFLMLVYEAVKFSGWHKRPDIASAMKRSWIKVRKVL